MTQLGVVAGADDASVAGLSGTFDWGEAGAGSGGGDVLVLIRDAEAPRGFDGPLVRLAADDGGPGNGREHVIAPAGEGLWRRSPWPANDELFALAPPTETAVLVVGPEREAAAVADRLSARGHSASFAERLSAGRLITASVVILLCANDSLPAAAMAVLAARRVLVTGPCEPTFGLQPGIEFLRGATTDEALELARIALLHSDVFVGIRALGALAAERHRASTVYGRLLLDLELGL